MMPDQVNSTRNALIISVLSHVYVYSQMAPPDTTEVRFNALLDAAVDAILVINADGVIETFAGNLFLTSSMVNVLVRDRASSIGRVGFGTHMRYGVVITLVSTAIGTAWVLLVEGILY